MIYNLPDKICTNFLNLQTETLPAQEAATAAMVASYVTVINKYKIKVWSRLW